MTRTNKIGKDSVNLTANVPKWLYAEVRKLAARSGVTLGEYVRAVLVDACNRGVQVDSETTITLNAGGDAEVTLREEAVRYTVKRTKSSTARKSPKRS